MEWDEILRAKIEAGEAEAAQGAAEELIVDAEAALGQLPVDYRHFLSAFGYASVGPDEIYGLGPDVPPYLNVLEITLAERRDSPNFPSEGIVIFNDGGGNLYFLRNLKDEADSPVFVWFHDDPEDIQIDSSSFSEWLLGKLS